MFKDGILKYENSLIESIVPFWENNCIDEKYGGYFTCLDRDGSVYDTEKYMWMQWRIVYMFATLYMTDYRKSSWFDIAVKGFDFLSEHGKDESGFYYFALNRQGVPSMAPYSIFSDCFAAMGSAALYRASGDEIHRKQADAAMRNYIRRIDSPKGKWEKSLPGRKARLNLGHFMILANLGHFMKECLGTSEYDSDVEKAINTVIEKFWNSEYRVIFENVNTDGTFDLNSCDGRHLIPGHGLESMWFILQHAEKTNDTALINRACDAIGGLLEFGWDKEFGGIYYFMDILGRPHIELQADMKLWWVHNEALIATLYAYKLTGREIFLSWHEKIEEWTWSHFPDPECGEWFGYLNRQGVPTHMLKGGKWKTFFHLPRFLLESINLMKSMQIQDKRGGND